MRGQRLFTRPIEAGDAEAIRQFLLPQIPLPNPPATCGLLGKVVGDLIAVATVSIEPNSLHLQHIVVAPHLRRKRIGRTLVDELAQMARKLDRDRIVVHDFEDSEGFFKRVGFERQDDVMVRRTMPA